MACSRKDKGEGEAAPAAGTASPESPQPDLHSGGPKAPKKPKTTATAKLGAAIKGAGTALKKSLQGRGSKGKGATGFEALGSEAIRAAQCLIENFVSPSSCTFEHFQATRLPAMKRTLRLYEGAIRALIATMRALKPLTLEDLPKGWKKEESVDRKLYQCVSKLIRPVKTESDGNCFYHSIAIALFGASEGGMGHLVIRSLCVVVALLGADHLKRLLEMEQLGGDAAGPAEFTHPSEPGVPVDVHYIFDCLVWDLYRPGAWGNRFSSYVTTYSPHIIQYIVV